MAAPDNGPRQQSFKACCFVHTLLRARDWQHRPEFDRVLDWWRNSGRGVFALVGIGGAGKTAIADQFTRAFPGLTAELPERLQDRSLQLPEGLFVFSLRIGLPIKTGLVLGLSLIDDRRTPETKP
ncbi:MAG: hypothetical protein IH991_01860 [Planctomycetes bacterium]|nr:hypothetical protein [Planctomycetota bacterium]